MRKLEISQLAPDFRYLQTLALKFCCNMRRNFTRDNFHERLPGVTRPSSHLELVFNLPAYSIIRVALIPSGTCEVSFISQQWDILTAVYKQKRTVSTPVANHRTNQN